MSDPAMSLYRGVALAIRGAVEGISDLAVPSDRLPFSASNPKSQVLDLFPVTLVIIHPPTHAAISLCHALASCAWPSV